MKKDRVAGRNKDVTGRIERQIGEWIGDAGTKACEAIKQAESEALDAWDKAKDAARKAGNETKARKAKRQVERDRRKTGRYSLTTGGDRNSLSETAGSLLNTR